MKFSAADLVKKSASQILYFELLKIQRQATPRQIQGNAYADKITMKEEASSEKRGIISLEEDLLFFCIDMIKDNTYVEIKMVDNMNDYPDWYLHSSVLQSTFYNTMLGKVKTLDTPKFRKKEGFKQEIIPVLEERTFELWFGEDKYEIFENEDIYDHYQQKLKVISKSAKEADFEEVRKWDSQFKFKEYEIFKPKFIKIV